MTIKPDTQASPPAADWLRKIALLGALMCPAAWLLSGCGHGDASRPPYEADTANATSTPAADPAAPAAAATPSDQNALNVYTWADYLAPDTIAAFEKLTGLKVHVSYFDTNETLESRVLTGHSGFDVVVPTAPFLQRQIRSGAYLALDKSKLPNLQNLDPALMSQVALNDPNNDHSAIYAWGTYGIGYNEKMVSDALQGLPFDSWRVIFDPAYAAKLAKCGIGTLDAPAGIVRLALKYLGKDPNARGEEGFSEVGALLKSIRPYIRTIDSQNALDAIANGDLCVAIGYSGDFYQARRRAREANNGIKVGYLIPTEGSLLWFDMLAIPRDAPHPANAYRFINYLMDPQVIAHITNYIGVANANLAALPFLDVSLTADPIVFPPPEQRARLFVQSEDTPERARAITRLWQRFKVAQ